MDNLHHDPRTKQQIKDHLYSFLYEPVQRQFQTRIDDIILRNSLVGSYSHKSFSYKGVFYTCDNSPPPIRKNRLVTQLRPDMESYLADLKELNEQELPHVLGYINQVLNSSDSFADYLLLFPSTIHPPLRDMAATCPCKIHKLLPDKVDQLMERNADSIRLLKRRLVTNFLI